MISSTGTSVARACATALVLLFARPAFAQSPTREGTAQALFDEGSDLFTRGQYDAACEKFRASNELDPRGGTLLNLALCREKQGRTASAWATFSEARNRSLKEGRSERVAFAEKKIADLRPLLPRLRIVVTDPSQPVEIKVDGEALPRAAWELSFPIDAGEHKIGATAPGHRAVAVVVRAASGAEVVATIPKLAREVIAEAPPPAPAPPPEPRWVGWTATGLGAAAVGVGSIFGVRAFSQRSDAESLCASARCDEGRSSNENGQRSAWIADVGIGVGLVTIAAGVYLLLRAPAPVSAAR